MLGREAIVEAIKIIEETGTRGTPQDEHAATKNKKPTAEEKEYLKSKLPHLWEKYGD